LSYAVNKLGGRALDVRFTGADFQQVRFYVTQVNSALHPSRVAKSSTSLAGGKGEILTTAGWQVTLWSHMACEFPVAVKAKLMLIAYTLFTYFIFYKRTDKQRWKHNPAECGGGNYSAWSVSTAGMRDALITSFVRQPPQPRKRASWATPVRTRQSKTRFSHRCSTKLGALADERGWDAEGKVTTRSIYAWNRRGWWKHAACVRLGPCQRERTCRLRGRLWYISIACSLLFTFHAKSSSQPPFIALLHAGAFYCYFCLCLQSSTLGQNNLLAVHLLSLWSLLYQMYNIPRYSS